MLGASVFICGKMDLTASCISLFGHRVPETLSPMLYTSNDPIQMSEKWYIRFEGFHICILFCFFPGLLFLLGLLSFPNRSGMFLPRLFLFILIFFSNSGRTFLPGVISLLYLVFSVICSVIFFSIPVAFLFFSLLFSILCFLVLFLTAGWFL